MTTRPPKRNRRSTKTKPELASLRQLGFVPEFRIAAPAWSAGELAAFERLAVQGNEGAASTAYDHLFADLGTRLWRVRRQLSDERQQAAKEGLRQPFGQVTAMIDALAAAGITIIDHTGEKWVNGRDLEALAFQPTAGLRAEIVLETVRPSIFDHQRSIQRAQVIVGAPDRGELAAWSDPAGAPANSPTTGTDKSNSTS